MIEVGQPNLENLDLIIEGLEQELDVVERTDNTLNVGPLTAMWIAAKSWQSGDRIRGTVSNEGCMIERRIGKKFVMSL